MKIEDKIQISAIIVSKSLYNKLSIIVIAIIPHKS